MPFFPPNPGRRPFPPGHRQRVRPVPPFRRQPGYLFSPNQNQQAPASKIQGLSGNLNKMMGHVGKVTNGVNMIRQIGSIISLFK
ncbi:hypothetical protein [Metabacillus fastidiosus]|uniref:YppG-like protein n=1 Tax=Metabacillus fastidiosus TaxID=1458 RepID=A0ABU6P1X7_9BACI|nr:hypothetical protein [Metabacillus fastidiosus]MED4403362.1 hypothetical protein [Metabacillus fastidiosus]MED4453958.1 hypothetical protein [Metabacillus fastidiosus]MED4460716.1 hypothetical protein [Metabacillus fastidiosus]